MDKGSGRAAGEPEERCGGRGISAEVRGGGHRKVRAENPKRSTCESAGMSSADKEKMTADARLFKKEMAKMVDRRINV